MVGATRSYGSIDSQLTSPKTKLYFTHAFKLLAPEALSSAIIGPKGVGVQEMQQTTLTRISVADRNHKYQQTSSRLVLIRAQTVESIEHALTLIVAKLALAADATRIGQDPNDLSGKQEGEYKLKVVVPKAAAGAVIGTNGGNVKELRKSSRGRIRVEERKGGRLDECAEQVVSLLGSADALLCCVLKINGYVQECSGHQYFQQWAHLSFKGSSKGGSALGPSSNTMRLGDETCSGVALDREEEILRTLRQMPWHLTDAQTFGLQASLPVDAMSGLIGKGGAGIKNILRQTGAQVKLVKDESNCTIVIEGALTSALSAYMLVMKRFLEITQTGTAPVKAKKGGK